jgi:ribose/xylose/arabinose/galactoside ABC-type transport system permease subunit
MQELEPTWPRVLSVWWLISWRGMVGAVLLGAAVGFVLGFVVALLHLPEEIITVGGGVMGGIIGLVWVVVVIRMALRKKYGDFRIALLPRNAER